MKRLWASLRFRLASAGFVAIYVPVLILLVVTLATEDATSVVESQDRFEFDVQETRQPSLSPWVVVTAVLLAPAAAGVAWWWAGRAVRPIERIRAVAEEIGGGDLDRRIGLASGPTEIVGLAASFDSMLERLAAAASTQRRLIEETSHELRTPLAVLASNADVLLAHPDPSIDVYRDGLQRSKDAAVRLNGIIDELLVDARGRARTLDRRPADLVEIAQAVIDAQRPLAETADVTVELRGPDHLAGRLDPPTVERAIANLVDNAIRHSPQGAAVDVEVGSTDRMVWVAVTDHGPGIPAEEQRRAFDRFWRAADDDTGVGLGLPIARHIAEAHGGRLSLESPGPAGDGCRFELWLAR